MRAEGQRDRYDEADSRFFRNFVNTPQNRSFVQRRSSCSAFECFPSEPLYLRNDRVYRLQGLMFVNNNKNNNNNNNNNNTIGTISKSLRQHLNNIPGNHEIKELQQTTILGTAHILREVLT